MKRNLFNLDDLSGYDFEDLVARIMKKIGYENIKVTPKSNDKGKDITMISDENGQKINIIVECKHQKFVGRPVVQKLIGAMIHEKREGPIKGVIVTSGIFGATVKEYINDLNKGYKDDIKIELIDGKKLKNLCEKYDIIILNGKIQIVTNNSAEFLSKKEIDDNIFKDYHRIIGHKDNLISFSNKIEFFPCYYIRYNINSEFYTSVGRIHIIKKNGKEIILDGSNGQKLGGDLEEHFFGIGFPKIIQVERGKDKKFVPFEFTEKDIEDEAFDKIAEENTENVFYIGRNNVTYKKICKPLHRDIEIKEAVAIYLPKLINEINIKKQKYIQKIFLNRHKLFYETDGLRECKICAKKETFFDKNLYLCKKCGRILCSGHKKLDFLDGTPVCLRDSFKRKLILQTKYFISKKNLDQYNKKISEMSFIRRFYEDKIAFWLSVAGIGFSVLFILGNLG